MRFEKYGHYSTLHGTVQAKNRTVPNFPYQTMFLWHRTTSDLVRERPYLRRLWAAKCSAAKSSVVLHVTATEFPVL